MDNQSFLLFLPIFYQNNNKKAKPEGKWIVCKGQEFCPVFEK
jgi:hypothetical protein